MPRLTMTRRVMLRTTLATLGTCVLASRRLAAAASPELALPAGIPEERYDFEVRSLEGWTTVEGQWALEEMPGAPSGTRVLVQRATKNEFDVIVAPPGPYTDVDVSMRFKPMSGREDASGGIVFRFTDRKYYVVRANALEDNLRLYYYDRGRRQLASAGVKAPALGQWHTLRVVAVGDASSRAPESRRRRSGSGTPFASSPWATASRRGSTARCTWITATRDSGRDASACGPRRTRSPRSMTSSRAV